MGPERQIAFIQELGAAIAALTPADREMITFIDIGGGYWPEQGEWLQPGGTAQGLLGKAVGMSHLDMTQNQADFSNDKVENFSNIQQSRNVKPSRQLSSAYPHYFNQATPIENFALELGHVICEHIHSQIACKICFEPGRWICNDSMHIILKVVDKKYDDLVITDGGTNAIGWERYETDYCPILNISRPAMSEKHCLITGSLCTPHDVWGYSYWGRDIQDGDLLMIPGQGAYTYSLRQNFIKAVPEVITFP
ncbi:MAG: hypothetical protein HQK65_04240 [Desulfamplus sp.]|nr:hypothetical protein [Desulfamplus sp.]